MANTLPFSYSPLDSPDCEIRLLILEAGEGRDSIRCEVIHVDIGDSPPYEALSYTWGNADDSREILVDGGLYSVRQNLWCALLHLRKLDSARLVWIDAICINQQDTEERNQQVMQMKQIYQKAERVVVWLGPSDYTTKTMFTFVSKAPKQITQYPAYAIIAFSKLEYWQRLWIIQEVLSAGNIHVQSGLQCMEWDDLARVFLQCRKLNLELLGRPDTDNLRGKQDPKVGFIVREGVLAQLILQRSDQIQDPITGKLSLIPLLQKYRDAKCEDLRDRAFGLLSLATACCKKALRVDYSATPSQLQQIILQHATQKHSLKGGKEYFLAALDLCRILKITTDEEEDRLYNLDLLFPRDVSFTVPWAHSTIALVSEMLNPDPDFGLHEIQQRKWAYYRAHTADDPHRKEPTWDHDTLQMEFDLENPKESGILDGLRKIAKKLNYEHLDRLNSNTVCRAFMDDKGRSGVGPMELRAGDLVCQFPAPQYALILRRYDNYYQIIGKSANTDSITSNQSSGKAQSNLKVNDEDGRPINFYMDRPMMRYCQGLRDPYLDFKGCRETSALGRLLTLDELHKDYYR